VAPTRVTVGYYLLDGRGHTDPALRFSVPNKLRERARPGLGIIEPVFDLIRRHGALSAVNGRTDGVTERLFPPLLNRGTKRIPQMFICSDARRLGVASLAVAVQAPRCEAIAELFLCRRTHQKNLPLAHQRL
jgi:hypothetical protein